MERSVDVGPVAASGSAAAVPRRRRTPRRPHLRGETNVGSVERLLSVVGGSVLAVAGARRRDLPGAAMVLAGAFLVERGATGHCMVYESLDLRRTDDDGRPQVVQQHGPAAVLDASRALRVEHSVTVARPRAELYRFWRDLTNLPRVMRHLESVTVRDATHSHWTARAPGGTTVTWDAVIHNEVENEIIAWKSTPGARVPNAGSVHFQDAPGGRGTEVHVVLEYAPPGGRLGSAVARLLGEEPHGQVRDDLRRFKAMMETGEVLTTDGQSSGRP
ncbi:MAG TPA: SRPBCC family protein [Gemmatimonadaceae bacterium]|nr:SRPBCC family protein [Gemmatimonadaceae bacterium]